jgi:hypothetical protein
VIYGDPLAYGAMLVAVPDLVDVKTLTSPYFLDPFPGMLFKSFVGAFGWMNLWLSAKFYWLWGCIGIVSALGYVKGLFQNRVDCRITSILLTIPTLSLALVIQLNLTFSQPQGRYLFPALPALVTLEAIGLERLPGWSKRVTFVFLTLLVILNIYILATVIIPSYWLSTD